MEGYMRAQILFFFLIVTTTLFVANYSQINNLIFAKENDTTKTDVGPEKNTFIKESLNLSKHDYINRIKIVANDKNDTNIVKEILLHTDDYILQQIDSVVVVDDLDKINCGNIQSNNGIITGCNDIEKSSYGYFRSNIRILSTSYWINWSKDPKNLDVRLGICNPFEYVLNHEFGHIDVAFRGDDIKNKEYWADYYAQSHTDVRKGVCV